jgi:hypothetical protein
LAKSNIAGIRFGGAELSIKYPVDVFGSNVAQAGLLEIEKEQIIQNNNYNLDFTDIAQDEFKLSSNASQSSFNLYSLTTVKEKFCHVKINISNILNLLNVSSEDFISEGVAYYYCRGRSYPFDEVDVIPVIKITSNNSGTPIGLTYTFENIQVIGDNNDNVSIDIYASSGIPTSFAGGIVEVIFNDNALSLNGTTQGFAFQRGEIIYDDDVYWFEEFFSEAPNKISIQVESFNVQSLYLLDEQPRKFGTIVLPIDDCNEPLGLEFLEIDMQGHSNHFTGLDPYLWEEYDPIVANDTDNSTLCGCENAPNIIDFTPKEIPAGMKDVLIITGTDFGSYDADDCRVIFRNGDDGGAAFSESIAEAGDIISWSDNEIKLYVPSATGGTGSFENPACSGRFKVVNACGDTESSIDDELYIPYAVFNVRGNVNLPATLLTIADDVEFRYANNVPEWARNAFAEALMEWCFEVNINFTISDETTSVTEAGVDNVNTITWEELASPGAQGALIVGQSYYENCDNPATGRIGLYMQELDIIINKHATDFQKVKNAMLHELGHAHMLQHAADPDAGTTDNYVMYYSLTGVDEATIKSDDAIGGNMVFSNSMEILDGSSCANAISQGNCSSTTSDLHLDNFISIYPNPNQGNFTVVFNENYTSSVEWKIHSIFGQEMASGRKDTHHNMITINKHNHFRAGAYLLTLLTERGRFSKKIIIYD